MTTEDCPGKEKVNLVLADIQKVKDFTDQTLEKYFNDLKKELCCVSYPVVTSYFDWKSFRFKKKTTQEKVKVFYRRLSFGIFELIVDTKLPHDWDSSENRSFELRISSVWKDHQIVNEFTKWGYPNRIPTPYANFVHEIIDEIALHTFHVGAK